MCAFVFSFAIEADALAFVWIVSRSRVESVMERSRWRFALVFLPHERLCWKAGKGVRFVHECLSMDN